MLRAVATISELGLSGSSSENDNADANVIFKVVDQHGLPRVCQVIQTGVLQLDRIYFNKADGTLPVKAEPSTTVTRIFSCNPAKDGIFNTMEVSAVTPKTGVLEQKVVIPNPNALSVTLSSGDATSTSSNSDDSVLKWIFYTNMSMHPTYK